MLFSLCILLSIIDMPTFSLYSYLYLGMDLEQELQLVDENDYIRKSQELNDWSSTEEEEDGIFIRNNLFIQ